MEDRITYITKTAAGMAAPTGTNTVSNHTDKGATAIKKIFVHHVFFWLKEPMNSEARSEFEKGLKSLVKVPQILTYHIGTPIGSPREVVDDSFTYSYIAFFKNKEDQAIYQNHPIHLKFVEDCQHLWVKVIVYDAMD